MVYWTIFSSGLMDWLVSNQVERICKQLWFNLRYDISILSCACGHHEGVQWTGARAPINLNPVIKGKWTLDFTLQQLPPWVKIPPVADEKEIESLPEAVWMLWTRENILPLPQETEENHDSPSLSSEWDFNLGPLKCATGLLSNQLQHFALTLWNGQPRVLLWCWFCHCFRHWKALQHCICPINTTCRTMCGKGPYDKEMKSYKKPGSFFHLKSVRQVNIFNHTQKQNMKRFYFL